MPEITVTLEHECMETCSRCSGSGEGMFEGSNCRLCGGTGIITDNGYEDRTFEVEYNEVDLSDIHILDYTICDYCGYDFYDEIVEEVKCILQKKFKNEIKINSIMEIP